MSLNNTRHHYAKRVADAKEALDDVKEEMLRKLGWVHECGHPGGLWLWTKHLRGRTYYVPTDTAIYLESNL